MLNKSFGSGPVLEGFSASVNRGSVAALTGPNGSGKSTLLRILWGELAADSGEILFAGERVDPSERCWKGRIGAVPDDDALVDGLSVRDHFRLCGALMGLGRGEAAARGEELIALLDLGEAAGLPDAAMASRGNRKRLAIALALLGPAELLLMDEPFAGLDAERADALCGLLATLSARGVTAVVSCHDEWLASRIADTRWSLGAGSPTAGRPEGAALRWLGPP